jgi:predicted pyridoxine 5'-phosphate oxidase superfamily flavin-nucleotide-binding protein
VSGPYHAGEIEAQRRAGVAELSARVGRSIRPTIPAVAARFLAERTFVVAATVGRSGAVRASILTGQPGFAVATGESRIEVAPGGGHAGTVEDDIEATGRIGLLAIDYPTRRRLRANGMAAVRGRSILVSTSQVYSNCPQHIPPRPEPAITVGPGLAGHSLSPARQDQLRAADSFFIATAHPEAGADASHRGGPPGFLEVSANRISWDDFPGNNMFNTIGNLLVEPRCALLFVDFAGGGVLQIEGTASVQWQPRRAITVEVRSVVG